MVTYTLFSQVVKPGERTRIVPPADFRLTTVTFGEDLTDESGRTTLRLYLVSVPDDEDESSDDDSDAESKRKEPTFEKDPVIITHLLPGRIETQVLDLTFLEDEPIEFEVTGKNSVHLLGNYIEQGPSGHDSEDEYDEEDAYALEDVSSDVEVDRRAIVSDSDDEMVGKIEAVDDNAEDEEVEKNAAEQAPSKKDKKKDKKRPRESDVSQPADSEEKETKKDKKKKQKAADGTAVPTGGAESKDKNVKTLPSGVIVDVRKVGDGPAAKKGQRLQMRYIGKLENGKVFDKNTTGAPFSFVLGKGDVIKGWDEGLVGLKVGSEALLTIPPSSAYGKKKQDGIPPNSTLKFEVKIMSAK